MSSGTYRAIQLNTISKSIEQGIESLQLVHVPRQAKLQADQIRIAIYASSLNYFDLLILINRYQFKPSLPYTMGSEGSGIITEIGSSVKSYKVGDSVIFGMSFDGACAEEVVTSEKYCLPKPTGLSHAEASALPVGYYTAYHALVQRGHVKKGDYVLVTGAGGGMGSTAVQLAVKLGCKVIAAASSDDKLALAKKLGAQHTINYSKEDMKSKVEEYTEGNFVDCCYEVVGGKVFDQAFRCMAPNSRLLLVGFASGKVPTIQANLVLVKGFDVVGVRSGAQMALHPEVAEEMAVKLKEYTAKGDRSLAPIIYKAYKPEEFREAYESMNKASVIGKASIVWREDANKIPQVKSKL